MRHYDIVILGGGAAGICCAIELLHTGKKILILDKELKNTNDRTWCYWEEGEGKFDSLLQHEWKQLNFYADIEKENMLLGDYRYKMLRSSSFYKWGQAQINKSETIELRIENVIHVDDSGNKPIVTTDTNKYEANLILDSVFFSENAKSHPYAVIQHFGGWFIKTKEPVFDSNTATLMDFRIDQEDDTRFFYVLPTSSNEALVEIAIFSNSISSMKDYDNLISNYISDFLEINEYSILEKEMGQIPMTTYPFHQDSTNKVLKIGTAGGWVKPSSGYAFSRIFKRSEQLVKNIIEKDFSSITSKSRHRWMDKVLLKAIDKKYVSGKEVFNSLFKKRKAEKIFRFLDEENGLLEDISFMYSAPILPFTRAAIGL